MNSTTVGERLRIARRDAGLGINELHKLVRAKGIRRSSYGSVRNYENGRSAPPLEYLATVARLLGVRQAWLAMGEGPKTEADRRRDAERDADVVELQARLRPEKEDEDWLERAVPGRTVRAKQVRAAVLRFARLLDDTETALTPWRDAGERWRVLRDALDFLNRADLAFDEMLAERRKDVSWAESVQSPLPDADPRATVMWYDALLAAFTQRVAGLGLPVEAIPRMREVVDAPAKAPKAKQRMRNSPSTKRTSTRKER